MMHAIANIDKQAPTIAERFSPKKSAQSLKRGFQPGQDQGVWSYDWKGMFRVELPSQYSVHLIKLTRSRVAKSPREGV